MPTADFFSRLGLFVIKGFLEEDLCSRLRVEVESSASEPSEIARNGDPVVDETIRRSKEAKMSSESIALLMSQLLAVKPQVESHFGLMLTDCQKPMFLVYRQGDFFALHQDASEENYRFKSIATRKVSVVVFLNGESAEPGPEEYAGGSLTFYGLMEQPHWQTLGFPLVGEPGLLVAFRPTVLHEVTPVSRGRRYTIVTWYC